MTPNEFTDFYQHWYPHMLRYMNWKAMDKSSGEDLVQEVFLQMIDMLEKVRIETADRLMWVIARHVAITFLIGFKKAQKNVPFRVERDKGTQSAEDIAVAHIMNDDILGVLGEREHYVVVELILKGRSYKDIAESLNVSVKTVSTIKDKALLEIAYSDKSPLET